MTLDEVMAMADEELRAKVIELAWRGIGDTTRDIAAAWELVEFAERERHFTCSIEKNQLSGEWEVSFSGLDEDSGGMWRASPFFHVKDSIVTRAITRAFILAMTQEES